jgi:hypothetical protein
MYSSLRGRFNPLNTTSYPHYRFRSTITDIAALHSTSQSQHRHYSTSQTPQHLYRLRALNVKTALAMISHHNRLVSSITETSLRF